MGMIELDAKVKELRELRRMAEELAAEIDGLTDSIKSEMAARIMYNNLRKLKTA